MRFIKQEMAHKHASVQIVQNVKDLLKTYIILYFFETFQAHKVIYRTKKATTVYRHMHKLSTKQSNCNVLWHNKGIKVASFSFSKITRTYIYFVIILLCKKAAYTHIKMVWDEFNSCAWPQIKILYQQIWRYWYGK